MVLHGGALYQGYDLYLLLSDFLSLLSAQIKLAHLAYRRTRRCFKISRSCSLTVSATFYTGCPCSNVLNIRSVYLSISAFTKQLHRIWPRCAHQSQQFSGDVVYGQQYAEIWRPHDVIWQDMDKGASTWTITVELFAADCS